MKKIIKKIIAATTAKKADPPRLEEMVRKAYHQTLAERWAADGDDAIFTPLNGKEKR